MALWIGAQHDPPRSYPGDRLFLWRLTAYGHILRYRGSHGISNLLGLQPLVYTVDCTRWQRKVTPPGVWSANNRIPLGRSSRKIRSSTGCRKAENRPIEPDLVSTSEGKE